MQEESQMMIEELETALAEEAEGKATAEAALAESETKLKQAVRAHSKPFRCCCCCLRRGIDCQEVLVLGVLRSFSVSRWIWRVRR